jgi:hypothetical protein
MNNNIIAAYKYNLYDNAKAIIIYYFVVLAVLALMTVGISVTTSGSMSLSGLDIATVNFLLIAGLVSFKESFRMFMQNGVSRKSIMASKILSAVSIALIMTAADSVLSLICKFIFMKADGMKYYSLFEQSYKTFVEGKSSLLIQLNMFAYNFLLYILMLACGFFISLLFYRLNKGGKIAVAVGVPVALIIVFPLMDGLLFNSAVSKAITKFLYLAIGFTDRPYAGMLTFVISSAIVFALSWLLLRRAVIKQ